MIARAAGIVASACALLSCGEDVTALDLQISLDKGVVIDRVVVEEVTVGGRPIPLQRTLPERPGRVLQTGESFLLLFERSQGGQQVQVRAVGFLGDQMKTTVANAIVKLAPGKTIGARLLFRGPPRPDPVTGETPDAGGTGDAGAATGDDHPGRSIGAGAGFTCAIRLNGQLRCWGFNGDGRVGDGTSVDRYTPQTVQGLSSVLDVSLGTIHVCAVVGGGQASCWGSNDYGQLGDGTTDLRIVPTAVPTAGPVRAMAAGRSHTCALLRSGQVQCWGYNGFGQLGDGTTANKPTPVVVPSLVAPTSVTVGRNHTCATGSDGRVFCWGANDAGELGDDTEATRAVPGPVVGLSGALFVVSSADHSCAVTGAGELWCWGANLGGQIGDGTTTERRVPVRVTGLPAAVSRVSLGGRHSCVVLTDRSVHCWGDSLRGQPVGGAPGDKTTPVPVTGVGEAIDIAVGQSHTCALLTGDRVRCWGSNGGGQLGDGTTEQRPSPVDVVGF